MLSYARVRLCPASHWLLGAISERALAKLLMCLLVAKSDKSARSNVFENGALNRRLLFIPPGLKLQPRFGVVSTHSYTVYLIRPQLIGKKTLNELLQVIC